MTPFATWADPAAVEPEPQLTHATRVPSVGPAEQHAWRYSAAPWLTFLVLRTWFAHLVLLA